MATLNLTKLFVNRLDSGVFVAGYSKDRSRQLQTQGEVHTYGGGRRRNIAPVGAADDFTFTMTEMVPADITTLVGWVDIPVQVRDYRGQRYVGVYHTVNVSEIRGVNLFSAGIALHAITWTDGV